VQRPSARRSREAADRVDSRRRRRPGAPSAASRSARFDELFACRILPNAPSSPLHRPGARARRSPRSRFDHGPGSAERPRTCVPVDAERSDADREVHGPRAGGPRAAGGELPDRAGREAPAGERVARRGGDPLRGQAPGARAGRGPGRMGRGHTDDPGHRSRDPGDGDVHGQGRVLRRPVLRHVVGCRPRRPHVRPRRACRGRWYEREWGRRRIEATRAALADMAWAARNRRGARRESAAALERDRERRVEDRAAGPRPRHADRPRGIAST
jgi:hypothetical protein